MRLVTALIGCYVLVTGCGGGGARTYTITGSVSDSSTLASSSASGHKFGEKGCSDPATDITLGPNRFADLGREALGSVVIVKDEKGTIVGTGRTDAGTFLAEADAPGSGTPWGTQWFYLRGMGRVGDFGGCVYRFTIPNVPRARFYTITVGEGHELPQPYSFDGMTKHKWRFGIIDLG